MNKLYTTLIALAISASALNVSAAGNIKLGILLGFTGPIESLTPGMASGAELAWKEVSDSGKLLDGTTITPVRADSTCVDAAAATTAAERLVNTDNVAAIMGSDCSGTSTAVANNVAVPNGVVMISPSSTAPTLSHIKDNGYFFRTAPSDARQGQVLANIVKQGGITEVAITYTNNDYGRGLNDSFTAAFNKLGGKVLVSAGHEDGKADYSAEIATLSAAGTRNLMVFGYLDQGGKGIIQAAIDTDAFDQFFLTDGMIGQSLPDAIGSDLNGSIGTMAGSESDSAKTFLTMSKTYGFDGEGPYKAESYDAAALIALSIQAAGSANRTAIRDNLMSVANAPGVKIYPGELAKGLSILANGGDIDYVGATDVEFNPVGEVFGSYKELVVRNQKFDTVKIW